MSLLINKNIEEKVVVGLMSGTSMDGIDAALVKLKNNSKKTEIELIKFESFSYPSDLRNSLLQISQPGQGSVEEICRMNFIIGEYFADSVIQICKLANFSLDKVDLIGSHGQTIHHLPDLENFYNKTIRSSLQIGDPSVISNRTGVTTVSNFRSADMALGGQGAPLIPYFDYIFFNSSNINRIILNIGGISNFTVLKKNSTLDDVIAFDTGPGNMIINSLMKEVYNKDFDDGGKIALSGKVNKKILANLLQHPYFKQGIPKSTGRKDFGEFFSNKLYNSAINEKLSSEDIIATATELTTCSIKMSVDFTCLNCNQVEQLIVSGGGIHNKAIMKSLKEKFNYSEILTTDYFGIESDAKEAICFAVLANETISGIPANLPSVTGAQKATLLGTVSFV